MIKKNYVIATVAMALALANVGYADPCPSDAEPGALDVWVKPGSGELAKVARLRSARVTLYDEHGDAAAQSEDDLSTLHSFKKLVPGTYVLRLEGDGLRTIERRGVVVVGTRLTKSTIYAVSADQ